MTAQTSLPLPTPKSLSTSSVLSLRASLGDLKAYLAAWIKTCVDYYEAAAMYEQLSKLSDAELQRRRLSRATLARDVCDVCGSTVER